jgi:hypothetical protein
VKRLGLVAGLAALAACEPRARTVGDFAADPDAARAVAAACARGRPRPDCEAARAGLAEARRRERMAAYETAF